MTYIVDVWSVLEKHKPSHKIMHEYNYG